MPLTNQHTTAVIPSNIDFQKRKHIGPHLLLDSDGQIIYANQDFCKWQNTTYQTCLHKTLQEVVPHELSKPIDLLFTSPGTCPSIYEGTFQNSNGKVTARYKAQKINIIDDRIFEVSLTISPAESNTPQDTPFPQLIEDQLHLLATLPWGMIILDNIWESSHKILWANPIAHDTFGSGQYLKKSTARLVASSDFVIAASTIIYKKQLIASTTTQLIREDNKRLSISIAIVPIQFNHKPAYAIYLHDVSESQYYAEQLADTEEDLNNISSIAKVGRWKYNLKTQEINWSKEAFSLLGIDSHVSAPSTKLIAERVYPDDLQQLIQAIEGSIKQRSSFETTIRVFNGKGKVYQLTSTGHYYYDIDNRTHWIKGHVQNTTKIHLLEEEVENLKKHQKMSHNIAKIGPWEYNPINKTLIWTEEFASICGWGNEKLQGTIDDFLAIVYPSERENVQQWLTSPSSIGKSFHCTILLDGGAKKYLLLRYQVVAVLGEKPSKIVGVIHDVTEIKQKEQDLHYHKYLSENVSDAIISTNIQMRIKTWNKAAEKIYGWKAEEVIGKRLKDVLFSRANPQVFEGMSSDLIRKGEWKGVLTQDAQNKGKLVMQCSAHLLKDHEGYLVGLVMVNRDLTDFTRIEKEAFENQQMLDLVFANIPGDIYWVDKNLNLLGCNPSFAEHVDINGVSIVGKPSFHDFHIDEKFKEQALIHINSVLKEEKTIIIDPQPIYFNKTSRWLQSSYIPIKNAASEVIGVLSCNNDITDSVLLQNEAESHRSNLTTMIEHAGYPLCYIDTSFCLKTYNTAFADFHQENFDSHLQSGAEYLNNIPENWKVQIEEIFIYVMEGNGLFTERSFNVQGQEQWFEITCNPVNNNSLCIGLFFSVRDISERKSNEQKQLAYKLKSEQMRSLAVIQGQEAERQRVSMELHDGVGQILTALQMQSSFLRDKDQLDPDKLNGQLQKIIHLVQDAKQEVRRISFNLMPSILNDFGLGPSIEQLCKTLFAPSNTSYEVNIELPEDKRFERTIEHGIFRIAQEIFNNAAKYSQATTIKAKLCIREHELHLSISDDGVGISAKKMLAIQQSGNGMSNIKQRVYLLGGSISIRTDKNIGLSYAITIPFKEK